MIPPARAHLRADGDVDEAALLVVDHLGHVLPELLAEAVQQPVEQAGDHRARQVHALVGDVVAVFLLGAAQRTVQQLVHHVPQVEALLDAAVGAHLHADVWQEVLLQQAARVVNSLRLCPRAIIARHVRTALRDEVQGIL